MAYLIGVDIGTSGTKTALFDETGRTLASATVEYPMAQPRPGWAEQDPGDWWRATAETIAKVLASSGVKAEDISGVGLSGQMHGAVFLDSDGNLLRSSIIWCDQRTGAECREITEKVGAQRLVEITANPALSGFTASKIVWVQKHQPEIWEKTAKILLPKDYVRYMLTGEYATEVSDASGLQLLDVPGRRWSDEVCAKLGVDMALLPRVYESYEISGRVSAQAAAVTGLRAGTPVAGGGGDQAAGAVGNGIVRPGVVSSTIGTSGVVFAHSDNITIDPMGRVHTFCHAVPGAWHVMGVTQAAGLSLQWFRNNFCADEIRVAAALGTDPYVLMDKEAALSPAGTDGLLYLPYLMGERTPHLDPDCRGVFFGLSARHTRRDMLRAVMEGVVHSMTDCMDIIRGMGVSVGEVRASGGGGRSPFWRQMQADMFGCDIVTTRSSEGPALGVALLAGVGAGVYGSVPEACDAAVRRADSISPVAETAKVYSACRSRYRALYGALKEQYGALAAYMNG